MERTTWAKIAFGLLLAALAARLILAFFPTHLPLEPYNPDAEGGELQETTITSIERCFSAVSMDGKVCYYYRVRTVEGEEGFLKTAVNCINEELVEPPENDEDRKDDVHYWQHVTGMAVKLPDTASSSAEDQTRFWEIVTFDSAYLERFGGNVRDAYAAFSGKAALDIDYSKLTVDNPACLWVNLLCLALFIWMVALLLAEYFSGRSPRKKDESGDSHTANEKNELQ